MTIYNSLAAFGCLLAFLRRQWAMVGSLEQRAPHTSLPPAHFLFKVSIWRTNVSISSEVSLLAYLGIRPLPLVMMRRRSSAEETLSEISDGPPKWRPSAALP